MGQEWGNANALIGGIRRRTVAMGSQKGGG